MIDALSKLTLREDEREQMHSLYKRLHAHPELSMQEHQTAELIEAELSDMGVEHFRCGGTGVIGILRNGEGPVVGFRADTDGLPIEEQTGLDYASTQRGTLKDGTPVPVMHGCGHDSHITALLTATRLLQRGAEYWSGTVVVIFQPGEETAEGARALVADGLWDRAPRPEVIFGQHVSPAQAGTVKLAKGTAMAMADSFRVTVYGRQTHGSQPENGLDPIVLGAHMVTRLQTIVSREVPALESAVVTVGTFHAGLKENIIPDRAEFTVNIRTLTMERRRKVLASVERIIRAEAEAADAQKPQIEKLYDFPVNYNDEASTDTVVLALEEALGQHNVEVGSPMLGSEDFGWLGESIGVPTVFWWFGGTETGDPDGPTNHSPFFAPALEPTLTTGVTAVLAATLQVVGEPH
jgi:amidohydrolase